MSKAYHYKKGAMQMGPYPLEKMRALARQGQVGRSHQISGDGGATWDTGTTYPEIFAAGEQPVAQSGPQLNDSESAPQSTRGPQVVPVETNWHFCTAAGGQQGPIPESQLRQLIQVGRVGPNDTVWTESIGDQWVAARTIPRLMDLFEDADSVRGDDERDARRGGGRKSRVGDRSISRRDGRDSGDRQGFNGAGLSGFICSVVSIVLLAIPCLVWVVVAESFFWIFNVVIPFTLLAIVGLVLSVIGLTKTPRGMATTGTVLGVIALMLGVMAIVGWFMLPYRLAMQQRTAIDSFATDIKLEQKNLADELAAYRTLTREDGEAQEAFALRLGVGRRRVGLQLSELVTAYDDHVRATAKTSEFRTAFLDLATLRKTLEEVKQAAQAVEGVEVIDVMHASNADVRKVKVLMDTLRLYERGEITLKQAEAKMTGT